MKITDISLQKKNPSRVNISVDGSYSFSLDVYQVANLGIRTGKEYSKEELTELETESQFGKLYARTQEYCLMRPHSAKEVQDYLWRKTRETKYKSRRTGEIMTKAGVAHEITERVFDRLKEKQYIDDEKFARYWVENRSQTKGASVRKLTNELRMKGVESSVINIAISQTERSDSEELQKIITKKRRKYTDDQKLMNYLARQGFSYDDIKQALARYDTEED